MAKVTCSLCGTTVDSRTMVGSQKLEPAIVNLIKRDRPEWPGTRGICQNCREQYRAKKFLGYLEDEFDKISEMEKSLVTRLAHRRSEEHTSELQSRRDLVCRLLLEKNK